MGKCPQSIGDQRLGLQAHLRNIVVGPQVRGWYPARSGLGNHTAVSVALRKDPAADPLARLDNDDIMSRALKFIPRYRSEEHTSELQSLMRISYAVLGLNKKTNIK